MQKFNSLYLNIFKNHINIKESELCDGMDKASNSYNYNPIIISNLLFQSVIQKDLDPPPIEFLNFICSKISVKKDSVFNISYIQIYQLLKKFNYKNSDAFFNSLNKLKTFKSGNLTIGVCSYNINKFYEIFSSEFMDINRIQIFFNNISNGTAGNTFSADPLLRGKFQNVCIYLNKDMIKQYSTWKDTLSHELSHFVQRVVNLDNLNSISNFDKIILNNPITGTREYSNAFNLSIQNIEKIKKILYSLNIDQNIFNNYVMYYLNMLSQTLKISELKTTTQNILNGFQRMYQHQNIVNNKPNYRKIEINHNTEKYLKQRLSWLNNILDKINDLNFFNTEFGLNVAHNFFNSSYKKLYGNFIEQKQFKDSVLIMQYLGIKNCLDNINIDERLKQHFKKFKFRN